MYSADELAMRQRVWGVARVLDLFLSLQLARPPAIIDGHASSCLSAPATSASGAHDPPAPNLTLSADTDTDGSILLFSHTVALGHIISRINLYLYHGFSGHLSAGTLKLSPDILTSLKGELDRWHQSLPMPFRISIGHQPTREVIELHMLYNVAIILLYRPL
jgi:hypothetical protein